VGFSLHAFQRLGIFHTTISDDEFLKPIVAIYTCCGTDTIIAISLVYESIFKLKLNMDLKCILSALILVFRSTSEETF